MSSGPELRLDWCSARAATFAVKKWHYSQTLPRGKNVYIGVWEGGQFIGVVIFGTGASAALGLPYGLKQFEWCELVRIALGQHTARVSRIISIAIRLLRKNSPGLRLILSFADPAHGHHGGIYQASGWKYLGMSSPGMQYRIGDRLIHSRKFSSSKWWGGAKSPPAGAEKVKTPGKYRYAKILDSTLAEKIGKMERPYPERTK